MSEAINLDDTAQSLHATALEKGFWDPLKRMKYEDHFIFYAKQLMMIDSEVTEVLEALRKKKGSKAVVEELSDILIRVLDLYAGMLNRGVITESLHDVFLEKADFNKTRDRLHGVAG